MWAHLISNEKSQPQVKTSSAGDFFNIQLVFFNKTVLNKLRTECQGVFNRALASNVGEELLDVLILFVAADVWLVADLGKFVAIVVTSHIFAPQVPFDINPEGAEVEVPLAC